MLVYGLISPHPPIILPEVGREDIAKVQHTVDALARAAQLLAQARPDGLIIIAPHEGHGFDVPLYYLRKHLPPGTGVEQILVTEPSYEHYYELGQQMGDRIAGERRRYAILASGDLSHVLKPDGPYGFDPAGPVLDEAIVRAVRAGDDQTLLHLDPATLEQGAECGLRSVLFLLGAVLGRNFTPSVLSYEGPFGVGYLVATYEPTAGDGA